MSTLEAAITLALAGHRHIAVTSDVPSESVTQIQSCVPNSEVVDVSTTLPPPQSTTVTIWTQVQQADDTTQRRLYEYLKQPYEYGIVIMVLDVALVASVKLYPYLKEHFWFSVYPPTGDKCSPIDASEVSRIRSAVPEVYVLPDIKRYIHSLIIFTRQHRMASLAPKSVRLPTTAIDGVRDLAVTILAWRHQKFVAPDTVKIAYKRVAYWLVDWETNRQFAVAESRNNNEELEKRYKLASMAGDWYGSDYDAIQKYIQKYRLRHQSNSPTGRSNTIVEDILVKVRPPI